MYTKIKNQLAIDWPIVKLGNLIEVRSSKRVLESDWTDVGVPFYRGRDVNKLSKKEDISPVFISHEKYLELKRLTGVPKIGDIIITAIGTLGKIHIVDNEEPFYFKDGTILWFKINNRIRSDYLKFLFLSNVILDQIKYFNNITTVGAYTIDTARNTLIILPDINKQVQISNFLNKNCDKIDNEVALLQQKSILLDEYKNALIYETVTKGLDKNAVMKDSGVEWIGETPNHWKIKRIKEIANVEKGKSNEMFDFDEKNIDLLPCIDTNFLRNRENSIMYNASGRLTNKGDVLILWDGANAGELFINTQKGYLGSTFGRFNNKKSVNSNFLFYYLKGIEKHFRNNLVGMGIPHVNTTKLKTTAFFHPPYEEQLEIVDFLNEKSKKIEKQIELIKKKVELLKEYKQSLIYEAVTGQLEIE